MQVDVMAKEKSKKPESSGEAKMFLKPPIHRIAANALSKDARINKELFKLAVPVAAAQMQPNLVGAFTREYGKSDIWGLRKIKHVVDNDKDTKLVVLDPRVKLDDTNSLSESGRSYIAEHGISLQPYTANINYDYWTAEEILAATLPPEIDEIPSGFSQVGHIAHMNLRTPLLPYKYHIGAVVLSKIQKAGITTVVNKLDNIDTVYRNFPMEVIAGKEDFIVTQPHLGCSFTFDFSKVYWNTRLATEHRRLVEMFQPGEAVCDVFAGVGPFALPAAKKRVFVLANDLNPDSYTSMEENIRVNKVQQFVKAYNEDGRDFIRASVTRMKEWHDTQREIQIRSKKWVTGGSGNRKYLPPPEIIPIPEKINHFLMNLPATAIKFLDAFRGVYQDHQELFNPHTDKPLPLIHVYCFQQPAEANESILNEVREALGYEIDEKELSIHLVRNVAPNKDMFCCTFRLPAEVAFARVKISNPL